MLVVGIGMRFQPKGALARRRRVRPVVSARFVQVCDSILSTLRGKSGGPGRNLGARPRCDDRPRDGAKQKAGRGLSVLLKVTDDDH